VFYRTIAEPCGWASGLVAEAQMLEQISVGNLVLIERMTLELSPGFNVLTGETGAGKSMIVDALGLVLGARARPDLVRSKAREAEVEALFRVAPGSRVSAKLEAAGIPCDGELVVRRVVHAEGRSRAFLNGRMCTAAQLLELAPDLCDLASQHESVSLTDPSTHLEYLDAFGRLDVEREALGAEVRALADLARELEAARGAERTRSEREDFLRFQLRELEDLDVRAGEETELEHERARLKHAGRLADVTRRAADRLYDAEGAMCDELARVAGELASAADLDASLGPLARTVESARAELGDAARALRRYAEGVEQNPARLGEIEERLFRLQKLLRAHGPTTHELEQHEGALRADLEALAGASERIADLERARDARLGKVSSAARALSTKRRQAADRLADAIGRELAQLAMGRARVTVDVAPSSASSSDPFVVDGARLGPTGIDRVEFLIAPNKGEDPRPLRRIASGGELSRALLALKRVLADDGPAGTYVFDEVDAGVGGAVAEVIGRAVADIARHRQVLCITHLPQIAAQADAHYVVDKAEVKGRTSTHVKRLSARERVDEIARMIGGVKVGDAARRAAEEMLKK
jgi:DNA repair protein RecN (Recombination protein N)